MKKAYSKDILRTINKGKKRFVAIMIITVLGVCMFTGLRAACEDLRHSADIFFDEQNLFDISIVSTLGLTNEDIKALSQVNGVESVEGSYSEEVYTMNGDRKKSAEVKVLSKQGINIPYLLEGSMPSKVDDILVTKKYINETGKQIGDIISIEEKMDEEAADEDKNAAGEANNETIENVISETESKADKDTTSEPKSENDLEVELEEEKESPNFLSTSFTITGIVTDVTDINSTEGAIAFRANSSTDYTFFVLPEAVESDIYTVAYMTLADSDQLLCYSKEYETKVDRLMDYLEANVEAGREQARYDEITSEALGKIADAEAEMNKKFTDAEKELEDAKIKLADAEKEMEESEEEINQKEADAKKEIEDARTRIRDGISQIEENSALYGIMTPEMEAQMEELQLALDELDTKEQDAAEQIAEARSELEEARIELADGKEELQENRNEFEEKKEEALAKIADAKADVEDIEMTEWYIYNRSSLSGYSNIESDADCIEGIGKAFPVIFLTIAILISLTTITRMVEEDRGLIGTYQALGFTDSEIRQKYVIYASLACILGGVLGDIFGFIVLPEIIFTIFATMYQLPAYMLTWDSLYGIGGILLFVVGIVAATIISCEAELKHVPATLMRPKAPRSGSRVLLERVTFVWKRLSFLNKVTARNLFRYKKRIFMTLFGIMGCTALLVCGYTIKDTVTELMPMQYENIYNYDLMLVAEDNEKLIQYLSEDDSVDSYINTAISNVKVINSKDDEITVQLNVIPDGSSLDGYINLVNQEDKKISLLDGEVLITVNASKVLGFKAGDTIKLQDPKYNQKDIRISDIVMNYLGNNVYMTETTYESIFGQFEANGAFVNIKESCGDQSAFAEEMAAKDGILTSVGTEKMKAEFEPAFKIINMVVLIILILAAALAFVVLFTLATTNISERERELATIKVLGFFDREVHLYVNKETLILTSLGILLGLPMGKFFGTWLMTVLNLPAIYFCTSIYPISYFISAALSFGFALIVNVITNKTLDGIDPVEALKSIE